MDFRKIILVGVVWIFSIQVFGQMDSTDLNLNVITTENNSFYDSIANVGTNSQLNLQFDISKIKSGQKLRIEVVISDFESNSSTAFSEVYIIDDLSDSEFIGSNNITLPLNPVHPAYKYQLFFIVEDSLGHHIISISKFLSV